MKDIKSKYSVHKAGAKARQIDFLLTFDEWWDIWQKSGHWDERGRRTGEYVMSRIGDIGPYAIGNVFIQLSSQNVKDSLNKPETREKNYQKRKGTRCGEDNSFFGRTHTNESRQKQSIANSNIKQSNETILKRITTQAINRGRASPYLCGVKK